MVHCFDVGCVLLVWPEIGDVHLFVWLVCFSGLSWLCCFLLISLVGVNPLVLIWRLLDYLAFLLLFVFCCSGLAWSICFVVVDVGWFCRFAFYVSDVI